MEDQTLAPDDGPEQVATKTHASIQIGVKLQAALMYAMEDLLRQGIELQTDAGRSSPAGRWQGRLSSAWRWPEDDDGVNKRGEGDTDGTG